MQAEAAGPAASNGSASSYASDASAAFDGRAAEHTSNAGAEQEGDSSAAIGERFLCGSDCDREGTEREFQSDGFGGTHGRVNDADIIPREPVAGALEEQGMDRDGWVPALYPDGKVWDVSVLVEGCR